MTTKEHLHHLIDELPESELAAAERFLEHLHQGGDAGLPRVLREAPVDDESETDDERIAVDEAWEDVRAGRLVSHAEVRRRLLGGQ